METMIKASLLEMKRGEVFVLAFIAGVFAGSFVMLVVMSMMFAAKQADERSDWDHTKR
jgi:uncharacterized paraquat-inducible protein A